ncbi:urease subunit beta [Candidatus Halobonum tyrrellensis]|uniref:Urease subunit beta n=1 Tax=Candidatus Halobonum tyrrellensis G22 TaxID=1324957 RepID=V4HH58_9EURY|nr:urease subunit beta [Candidatus Halobonum tyrrellensis]ESP90085.1 urease subunit beta [Candidatus Halobonum tyrrellensis G22]
MSERTVPGELVTGDGTVTLNEGRETAEVRVANTGDRPVQVGSHFHFFEANAALAFDRAAAFGRRLNVPAGTAVRFEPGDEQTVELVDIGGKRRAHGMNGLVNGTVGTDRNLDAALERLRDAGFADTGAPDDGDGASGPDGTPDDAEGGS